MRSFLKPLLPAVGLSLLVLGSVAGRNIAFGQGTATSQPTDTGPAQARFQSVPVAVPAYANPYGGYYPGAVGGALSGAADVINSQGQFMVQQQQAFKMREQVRQSSIQTRRMHVDEYIYERKTLPTTEDERERIRLENLRRSRNNPTPTEIWSGKALNDLLLGIQQQQSQRQAGPDVPVDPQMMRHINVTSGKTTGSVGLLRDGGRLSWPLALLGENFDSERKGLDQLAVEASRQTAFSSGVDARVIRDMTNASNKIQKQLKTDVEEISAGDYMKAKRFMNEVDGTIAALQDPNIGQYTSGKLAARGNSVAELTMSMSRDGLKFAAALSGDENAYNALHQAMVAYYIPADQSRRWDPEAK